jgi:hypothetical protein
VLLEGIRPDSALSSVTAIAGEAETAPAVNWWINAYAVRPASRRPPSVAIAGRAGSDEFGQASATCPAGKHLIGIGGEIVGRLGQVLHDDLRADGALTKTSVTGFEDDTDFTPTGTERLRDLHQP